ncbi:MAG TPA: hypothetical protein VLJ42_09100 [Solirubrobacteraceae bacterium]|nr:hypothetical protein [Solirubrobacteraceae bacterium]
MLALAVAFSGFALAATPALASFHRLSTSFGSAGSGDGQLALASNSGVAVNNATHDLYVADTGNARVDQFSSAGVFVRAWGWGVADGTTNALQTCTSDCHAGLPGAGVGQFTSPTFIAVDNSIGLSQGDVYVGDTASNAVLKFSASGTYISTNTGSAATAPVNGPFAPLAGVTVDGSGDLWVYDTNSTMFEFAQDSSYITDFDFRFGVTAGGIDIDAAGNLYVLESAGVVEQFTPVGVDVGAVNGDARDALGLALNRSTGELYMNSGGSVIRHYLSSCDAGGSCTAADTFGSRSLSAAAGLGVDPSNDSVFVADSGAQTIAEFIFTAPAPPVIDETSVVNVTPTSVDLRAQINPQAADTTYHFEYGSSSTYGQSTPNAVIPADFSDNGVTAHVQGLAPNTTYHFRVVASNSAAPGGVAGLDQTFTTPSPTASFALPDNRGYELVTPAAKGDGSLLPVGDPLYTAFGAGYRASVSGDKLAYLSVTPFPGSQAGGFMNYIASRGNGWSSQSLDPPQAQAGKGVLSAPQFHAYTPDLSKAALEIGGNFAYDGQDSPPLVPGEPADNHNLFLRDNTNASYQLMDLVPPGVAPHEAYYQGGSTDLSHIIFRTFAQLTPDALSGYQNVYQWTGGANSLVSQVPVAPATRCGGSGPACVPAPDGATVGALLLNSAASAFNAVSSDGSKIFFTDGFAPDAYTLTRGQVYMRENGTTTTISASQKTNGSGPGGGDPNGPLPATYLQAAADGARAFFKSCEQLTNDSTAVATGVGSGQPCNNNAPFGNDLYQYDTAQHQLSDVSVDSHGDPFGADVQGMLGSSTDGSYVYFVANGVLAAGASLGDCQYDVINATVGQCNLYVSHNGTVTFIARLDGGDQIDWNQGAGVSVTARVTPDGTRLAFQSRLSLTGYDNKVASGSTCAQRIQDPTAATSRCQEVFLYDASSKALSCVSCNPSGAQPLGPAMLTSAGEYGFLANGTMPYLQRNLSDDGSRLFFDSGDALVPGDVDGKVDVYEYTGGHAALISSGTSAEDATFLDASPSGNDVFFATGAALVGQDADSRTDIYDARVGGGFAFTAPAAPCVGESCRAAPSVAGLPSPLGSSTFSGAGNPGPGSVTAKGKALTRAQRLAGALRVCTKKPKRKRASCRAHARRLYGPKKAVRRTPGHASRRAGR